METTTGPVRPGTASGDGPGPDDAPTHPWLVHGSLVLVQVFFGLHYLAAKVVLTEIPPATWALIRVTGGAVVLFTLVGLARRPLPRSGPVLWRLGLFSIFGVVINQLCFVEGLARTTAGHSSILMTSIPVSTLLFAVLLRRERMTGRKLASLGVALTGVFLVIGPTTTGLGDTAVRGDLLTLANALSYSMFLVISKRVLARVDPLSATALLLGFGTLGMAPLGLPSLAGFELSTVSPHVWVLAALIIVFPTAGAYLLTYWALARVESSVVAFFIYLQPVIATTLSVILFGERLSPKAITGAAMIFVAVYLVLRRPGKTALP